MPGHSPATSNLSHSSPNPERIVTITGDESPQELQEKAKMVVRELGFLIVQKLGIEDDRILNENALKTLILEVYDQDFTFDTSPKKAVKIKDQLRRNIVNALDIVTPQLVFINHLARKGKAILNAIGEFANRLKEFGADPVMLFNGQFTYTSGDLTLNGAGMDFEFVRTYKNQAAYLGPLGHNWDHNYNLWLRASNDEQSVVRSNGALREDAFTRHPDFDYWVPPDGEDGIILKQGNVFIYRMPDGTRYEYRQLPQQDNQIYFIDRIEDRFQNYLKFFYVDDRLDQIEVNHPGRWIKFRYDIRGRISTIQDFTGRIWQYHYDDFDDLVAVTSNSTSRYPYGSTTCYEYSTSMFTGALQHNLITITDPGSQMYLENEYGADAGFLSYNRVVRQRQGKGVTFFDYEDVIEEFEFDYKDNERPAHQTIVTHRNGHTAKHIYNKYGNMLLKEEYVLIRGLPSLLRTYFRYNEDGNMISMLSPGGIMTQFLYRRTWFEKQHQIQDPENIPVHPDLDMQTRQGFNQVLATVQRHRYFKLSGLDLSRDIWGDIFPDVLQPDDLDENGNPLDVITKFTYEPDYGQILTRSDPRFTNNAMPDTVNEHPRYNDTLTRYDYNGPPGDSFFQLATIHYPRPVLADGTPGNEIIEKFELYDSKGRLRRQVNPVGTITLYEYFPENVNDTRSGHLQKEIQDAGQLQIVTEYEVDELGRVIAIHHPKSKKANDGRFISRTIYNRLDQVVETISSLPFEFRNRFYYDQNGMVQRQEREIFDDKGHSHPDGPELTLFRYDELINRTMESRGGRNDSTFLTTKHLYGPSEEKILDVFPRGNSTKYTYNERLLLASAIKGFCTREASRNRFEYDADGRVFISTDALGNKTHFSYDTMGRITVRTNALGHKTFYSYDKNGNQTVERFFEKQQDGRYILLARGEMKYDELNRPVEKILNRFDQFPAPVSGTNLKLAFETAPGPGVRLSSKTIYDETHRIIKEIDHMGRETSYEYDGMNRILARIDPLENRIVNTYDDHGNLIRQDQIEKIQDPGSSSITGQRVFSHMVRYDELDRVSSIVDSMGNTTRYFYTSRNLIARMVDPLGNTTRREYDIYGRMEKFIRDQTSTGLGGGQFLSPAKQTYEFDQNNNVVSITDPLNRKTRYEYDSIDRRRAVIYPDNSMVQYDYDKNSNPVKITDINGLIKKLEYDGLNRNIQINIDQSGINPEVIVEGETFLSYHYDGLSRKVKEENDFCTNVYRFDSMGWRMEDHFHFHTPLSATVPQFQINREFNDNGELETLIYPGGRQLNYHRDELGRIIIIENKSNGINYPGRSGAAEQYNIMRVTYNGLQRQSCLFGNDVETQFAYDASGRMIQIDHKSQEASFLQIQYLYDGMDNMRLQLEITPSGNHSNKYSYDSFYRLINVNSVNQPPFDPLNFAPPEDPLPHLIPGLQLDIDNIIDPLVLPPTPHSFEYDLTGNRQVRRLESGSMEEYFTNDLDQYISIDLVQQHHDLNGNLIRDGQKEYIYNAFNQIVRIVDIANNQTIVRYFYDASGRRILENDGDQTTHLLHDKQNIISEFRQDHFYSQYIYDDGVDHPIQLAVEGEDYYYHSDLNNSVRRMTNSGGNVAASYEYTPFGNLIGSSEDNVDNPVLFTSRRYHKKSGVYDYRTRQYHPVTGRFLQRDPAGMRDGTNLYTYTRNNPLIHIDPFGMEREQSTNIDQPGEALNDASKLYKETGYPYESSWITHGPEFFNVFFFGGKGPNARKRYRTLSEDQQWARTMMDRGWGCTLCHVSKELPPEAINPENGLPYDWAINRRGFDEWVMYSSQARFLVEGLTAIGSVKLQTGQVYLNSMSNLAFSRAANSRVVIGNDVNVVSREIGIAKGTEIVRHEIYQPMPQITYARIEKQGLMISNQGAQSAKYGIGAYAWPEGAGSSKLAFIDFQVSQGTAIEKIVVQGSFKKPYTIVRLVPPKGDYVLGKIVRTNLDPEDIVKAREFLKRMDKEKP